MRFALWQLRAATRNI